MPDNFVTRLRHAWSVFNQKEVGGGVNAYGPAYSQRPDRQIYSYGTERSITSGIYTRLAIDVASTPIRHVRLDGNGRFAEVIDSGLNYCLNTEANVDQTGRDLRQNIASELFENGVCAIVPVDTSINPKISNSYEIYSIRVGTIIKWMPSHVTISVYNEKTGERQELTVFKSQVAIVYNPFYAVMNQPSSTLQRLIHKLNILDAIDEQSGSGRLDIVIQLPYAARTTEKQKMAKERQAALDEQMANSRYGIGYLDATEKLIQLNRPAENNLMAQIEYLTELLYSQLGLSPAVFNGTATEEQKLDYHNRTIDPILAAITDSLDRRFITRTARTQGQSLSYWRDPFAYTTPDKIADIAEKTISNEILSPNDIRAVMHYPASKEQGSNSLKNRNINPQKPGDVPKEVPNQQPADSNSAERKTNAPSKL